MRKYLRWFYIVPTLAILLAVGMGVRVHYLKNEQQTLRSEIKQQQNRLHSLVQAGDRTVYVFQDASVNSLPAALTHRLSTVGQLMLNFNSGSQYDANRKLLEHQYINDNNFFNGDHAVMGSATDMDGNNAIATEGLKSSVAETIPGRVPGSDRYYLLIKTYFYKNQDTLDNVSVLKPSYRLITFNYNNNELTNVQKVDKIGLVNSSN